MSSSASVGSPESITAVDFIESQQKLEDDAREVLPYDPTHCTFFDGPLRQPVYACLTCIAKSKGVDASGVCYSCSIQCHSDHDLIELFNKRNFTCDCGTTRMSAFGGCNLRKNFDGLDIPSSSNRYDHNFKGRFCSCDSAYDPETERGTMYQCLLGDVCNEDWYHEECIMGLPFPPAHKTQPGLTEDQKPVMPPSPKGHPTKVVIEAPNEEEDETDSPTKPPAASAAPEATTDTATPAKKKEPAPPKGHPTGVNLLPELVGDLSGSAADLQGAADSDEEEDEHVAPPGFPDDDDFEAFICWKCVSKHRAFLGRWAGMKGVALEAVVRKQPEEMSSVIHSRDVLKAAASELKRHLEDSEAIVPSAKRPSVEKEKDELAKSTSSVSSSSTSSSVSQGANSSMTSRVSVSLNSIDEDHETGACKLPTEVPQDKEFSLFLCPDWREKICRCEECLKFLDRFPMLKDEEVTYEPPQDEDETSSLLDAGARALNSMPRVNAMEGIYAYEKVKSKLSSFLKPFAEDGRIVSEEDVKAFLRRSRIPRAGVLAVMLCLFSTFLLLVFLFCFCLCALLE
ncbi:hypothetical protein BZA70DRAFT_309969 [Myxozyma melibiosi]|uniref:UBR-type domain-containing protein n=1 Tax=Myxozyma melibiosi TaxID=54550 RepID=A0ABR1FAW5_9ASCO